MADRLEYPADNPKLVRALGDRRYKLHKILLPLCNEKRAPERFARLSCELAILGLVVGDRGFAEIEEMHAELSAACPEDVAALEEAFERVEMYLTTGAVDLDFAYVPELE